MRIGCVLRRRAQVSAILAAVSAAMVAGCASAHPPIVEREVAATDFGGTSTNGVLCELEVTSYTLVFPNHSTRSEAPTVALVRLHTRTSEESAIGISGALVIFGDDDRVPSWELRGPDKLLAIVRPAAEYATFVRSLETKTSRTVMLRSDDRGQLYTEIRLR